MNPLAILSLFRAYSTKRCRKRLLDVKTIVYLGDSKNEPAKSDRYTQPIRCSDGSFPKKDETHLRLVAKPKKMERHNLPLRLHALENRVRGQNRILGLQISPVQKRESQTCQSGQVRQKKSRKRKKLAVVRETLPRQLTPFFSFTSQMATLKLNTSLLVSDGYESRLIWQRYTPRVASGKCWRENNPQL